MKVPIFKMEDIIYEDNHLLAYNKPGGMLTQGDNTGDLCARDYLIDYIKTRDNKPGNVYLNPAHRLDRTVSGVLLFSKTSKAIARLHKLFKDREIAKTYIALCENKGRSPKSDFYVEGYIRKNRAQGKVSFKLEQFKDSKYSRTHCIRAFSDDQFIGMILKPETGRSHQLRVHLHSVGFPIYGDVRYGASERHAGFIYLHARSLEFIHPVKKEPMTIVAPIPEKEHWLNYLKSFPV